MIFSFKKPPVQKEIGGKKYLGLDRVHNFMGMVSGKRCGGLLSGACEVRGFIRFYKWIVRDANCD